MSLLYAFIRLFLVRNSFAENTPLVFSPGMFINIGSPAPLPMNIASYPSSKISSTVMVLPTITLVSTSTPNFFRFSISTFTIFSFGSLNSGIPYTNTPPGSCNASNIFTW